MALYSNSVNNLNVQKIYSRWYELKMLIANNIRREFETEKKCVTPFCICHDCQYEDS